MEIIIDYYLKDFYYRATLQGEIISTKMYNLLENRFKIYFNEIQI